MIFLALKRSAVVFIILINVKMSTIVCILAFMSRKTFILSSVEHEKSFITWSDGEEDDSSQTKFHLFWQSRATASALSPNQKTSSQIYAIW